MNEAEKQSVCDAFGLGRATCVTQLGGTRNRNFLLTATSGKWFVRHRYAGYCGSERIAFDQGAIEFLNRGGAAVVAPRRAKHGVTFHEEDGRCWEVFPAVAGHHFREGDPEELRGLAKGLAEFHRVGRAFTGRYDKLGLRGETDPAELFRIVDVVREQAPAANVYREWIAAAAKLLPDGVFESLPHTLIHGDVQPANVLMEGGRVVAFVDRDWCAWRPRVYDLAFAILLCCAKHDAPIRGEDIWSLSQPARVTGDQMQVFLEAYQQCDWPLESRELAALRPQIALSWCHCRLAGAMKVEPARRQEFLARPPRDINALFS
jgi:Ser/Thr protein kinase RdoA (MazF antagonist)